MPGAGLDAIRRAVLVSAPIRSPCAAPDTCRDLSSISDGEPGQESGGGKGGSEGPGPAAGPHGRVRVEGVFDVDRTGNQIALVGAVRSVARLECDRCLRTFDRSIQADLTVVADRSGSARGLEEDLERDRHMMFHDGRQLDLREETRDALLLELPISAHCEESCKGLCPRCGADLNLGPCGCPGA